MRLGTLWLADGVSGRDAHGPGRGGYAASPSQRRMVSARALAQLDRHLARRVGEHARLVRVRVGEEDGVHLRPRREQPRNGRRDTVEQRLADPQSRARPGRFFQVSQRQARVDEEARAFGGEFHTRAANLFRTAMDDEFHK